MKSSSPSQGFFGSNQALKVFDCYRPMKAVDFFVRWAEDLEDTEQKSSFYPDIAKMNLFKKGYIAKVENSDFLNDRRVYRGA